MEILRIKVYPGYKGDVILEVKALNDKGKVIIGNTGSVSRSQVSKALDLVLAGMSSTENHYPLDPALLEK